MKKLVILATVFLASCGVIPTNPDDESKSIIVEFSKRGTELVSLCDVDGSKVSVWKYEDNFAVMINSEKLLWSNAFARRVSKEYATNFCKG